MTDMASNGTPLDTLTEDDWETLYGLGKFDTIAAEKVWSWVLDGTQDDDTGNSSDWKWWAARFDANGSSEIRGGVIVEEKSDGSVFAYRYDDPSVLNAVWEARELEYSRYVHGDCKDGVDCLGCSSCLYR